MALLIVLITILVAPVLEASDRPGKQKYLAYNVGLTSIFTLISGRVQRHSLSGSDVARLLFTGAGAGVAFYEAKRIAGAGRTTEGWLIANATSSVVENTAGGERALGRIGYTVGPFRLRFATPLARTAVAEVEADWSLAETTSLIKGRLQGDHFRVRHGLIAIDRDTAWPTKDVQSGGFQGMTNGVFPGIMPGQPPVLWSHEVIHAIQDQQMDSVEPPIFVFGGDSDSSRTRFFAFRNIRLGFIDVLDLAATRRPYFERWNEVEAYGLAQRMPVPH